MTSSLRLAFLIPALLIAVPAAAENAQSTVTQAKAPIRYVTLDKMIRGFAARARAEQAAATTARPTVLAQR